MEQDLYVLGIYEILYDKQLVSFYLKSILLLILRCQGSTTVAKEMIWYETIRYVMFDYWKFYRHQSTHTTLNIIQSFSHIPHIHKANLTMVPPMIQWCNWISGGAAMLWNLSRLHHFQGHFCKSYLIIPHSTWLEKAASMLAEKLSVMNDDPTSRVKMTMQPKSCATLDVSALKSCDFRCTSTSRIIKEMRICNSF